METSEETEVFVGATPTASEINLTSSTVAPTHLSLNNCEERMDDSLPNTAIKDGVNDHVTQESGDVCGSHTFEHDNNEEMQNSEAMPSDNAHGGPNRDTADEAVASTPDAHSRMLDRVSRCDGFFKPQQRGDPELNMEEKRNIASDLLLNKPAVFLTRFGKFLEEEDLCVFTSKSNDYVIQSLLAETRKRLDSRQNEIQIRNRRYEAMKKLLEEGSYFSDDEIKQRDPLLYEQMVGKHITEEEAQASVNRSDLRFSTILLKHMDVIRSNIFYNLQKDQEQGQEEENDSEDESEESEIDENEELSNVEKQQQKEELMRIMQLRFLAGQDVGFDYSTVDGNAEYDPLTIRTQDEEEKYFDAETPESAEMDNTSGEDSSCVPKPPIESSEEEVDYMDFDVTAVHRKQKDTS